MNKIILSNTGYQLCGRAISAVTSLLITIVVSQKLGVFHFGELIKVISFVSPFYMVVDFGINAIAVKAFSQHRYPKISITTNLLLLRLVLAVIAISVCWSIALLLPGNLTDGFTVSVKQGVVVFSATILIQAVLKTTSAVFQYHLTYKYTLIAEILQSIILFAVIFFVLPQQATIFTIIYGYVCGGIVAVMSQLLLVNKTVNIFSNSQAIVRSSQKQISNTQKSSSEKETSFSKFNWKWFYLVKSQQLSSSFSLLLIPALPLGYTIIINTITTKMDIFFLTLLRSTIEVGYYGLSKRIVELFLVIPYFLSNSLYPFLLKKTIYKSKLVLWVLYMGGAGILCGVLLWLTAPLVIFIKKDFQPTISLLRLQAFGLPLFFMTAPLMWSLIARDMQKHLVIIYSIGLVANMGLVTTLISFWGAYGAIVATLLTELLVLCLLVSYHLREKYD